MTPGVVLAAVLAPAAYVYGVRVGMRATHARYVWMLEHGGGVPGVPVPGVPGRV